MKFNKGFTLIELLVVIAIIGILSSVVLASLNTARAKGADAAIKGNLNGIRSQAELYYDGNTASYGVYATSTCLATTGGTSIYSDSNIRQALGAATTTAGAQATCGSNAYYWAVSVPLKGGGHWCVDSVGSAKQIGSAVASAGCN